MAALTTSDVSLLSFLNTADEREEERLLLRLISEYAEPVVRRVLRQKLKLYSTRETVKYEHPDIEEIYHDIQLHLLKRLRDLKKDPSQWPVSNLQSYIASTAYHACDEYLRRKYPARRHLKDRVRYHLMNHQEFRLTQSEKGWLAGLSSWERSLWRAPLAGGSKIDSRLLETLTEKLQDTDASRLEFQSLLQMIFSVSGRPLELDSLVGLIAKLQGIKDQPTLPLGGGNNHLAEILISPQAEIDVVLQYRQLLHYLWKEICQLSRRQRIALLFNLKSPNGVNVITLLPATRVATFEEIASALELPVDQFEQIWAKLPMDDLSIGQYLGATRQQVINLRKNARERLIRRMEAFEKMR